MATRTGTVVAAFGRQYEVLLDDGATWLCYPRGKKSLLACGDRVTVDATGPEQGVVVKQAERKSLLYRSDQYRQKLIAANADQVVLFMATEPGFSTELISRCLVAVEEQDMTALLALNKCDLAERLPMAREQLAPFARLGYPIVELSALSPTAAVATLAPHLAGKLSVLVGQSGMGKSTFINALLPDAGARTREISEALDTGKHTTTFSRLYPLPELPAGSAIIDCPGLQEFGLAHLSRQRIEHGFIEFHPHLGQCRFRDCRHDREPDCAIRAAVDSGAIHPQRYAQFQRLVTEAQT